MRYLLTAKQNGKNVRQSRVSEAGAINTARKCLLAVIRMEETSADLQAMKFIRDIEVGAARGISNKSGDTTIIFQKLVEKQV